MTEPAQPPFLTFGAWEVAGRTFEIASRRQLDSRQVLPWFLDAGVPIAGVLERERAARVVRGAPADGLEAIGFDFSGVDETGDLRDYGRAVFARRAGLEIDDGALAVPLPSWARAVGYLTELTLPLLLRVRPPASRDLETSWDGGHHRILFRPVAELAAELRETATPQGEELLTLLGALVPPPLRRFADTPSAGSLLARVRERILRAANLRELLGEPPAVTVRRLPDPAADELRFLHLDRHERFEIVTPSTSVSATVLPMIVEEGTPYFLLWQELRPAALERRARQPLYDLPVPLRAVNATGAFVELPLPDDRTLAERVLGRAFGDASIAVLECERLGPGGEPAVSVSTEIRHRLLCVLDPASIRSLPADAFLISAPELAKAVGAGLVRDPVLVAGVVALGLDPFKAARAGDPPRRRAFLDRMTSGSVVERRLKGYSSIEAEQLAAPTYARLMTVLQHEFGLRIVYPRAEKDRSFFKAAYRVFMASDRGEDRALQGLHFSHDCFHFALGNFTPPPLPDFEAWYQSGDPAPADLPPEGRDFDAYATALKHAENEATFFSFWTLYAEHFPLARHVGKLTFYAAMRDLGITDRAEVWPLYLALVQDAVIPPVLADHPVTRARADVAELFEYMRGFRDYHFKDIAIAWKYAVKEPYRTFAIRFGIYEHDLERYLAGVRSFSTRLAAYPPGLNPLLCACADVKVDLALRVFDVMKMLRLVREPAATAEVRRDFLDLAEEIMVKLESLRGLLGAIRERVHDAEITPDNEDTNERITTLAARVERVRQELWDRVAASGVLPAALLAEERTREVPR